MKRFAGWHFWLFSAFFLFFLYLARKALLPFLIAFVLAYLLDPLLDKMEEKKIPRTGGIFLLLGGVLTVMLAVGFLLYPVLEQQVIKGLEEIPLYAAQAQERLAPLVERLSGYDRSKANELIQNIMEKVGSLPMEILKFAYGLVVSAFSSLAGMISALFGMVVIPVATFYFMRDIDLIKGKLESLIPKHYREITMSIFGDINKMLSAFVRGQLTVALVMAFFYSLGLYLIGTPMGLFIGLLAGFANIVPYLPLVVGFLPALILTYLHFGFEWHLLAVSVLFAGVQLLEGFYLTPRIMGKSIGLHPVVIMLALLIGGLVFGFIGLILAVPAAAVIKVLLHHLEKKYRSSKFFAGEEPPPE